MCEFHEVVHNHKHVDSLQSSAVQKSMHTSCIGAELLMFSKGAWTAGSGVFPITHL